MDEWKVSYDLMLKGFSLWGTVLGLYEGLFISEILVSGGLIGDGTPAITEFSDFINKNILSLKIKNFHIYKSLSEWNGKH